MPTPNIKVTSLDDLQFLVKHRKCVTTKHGFNFTTRKFVPASFIYNMNASLVHGMINRGLYLYVKKSKTN